MAVRARRAPDAPSGCPTAMAPPLGLRRSSSSASPSCLQQPSTWVANASLISITSICARVRPARASALRQASTGPRPMTRGATPATAPARIRARGTMPAASPAAREPIISAAAPSFTPEAFPAVMMPPSTIAGSFANFSAVVPARGCSSSLTISGSFLRPWGTVTGRISSR